MKEHSRDQGYRAAEIHTQHASVNFALLLGIKDYTQINHNSSPINVQATEVHELATMKVQHAREKLRTAEGMPPWMTVRPSERTIFDNRS